MRNSLPFLNSKEEGAMKSFTERPEGTRVSQSKTKGTGSPIWNILCMTLSLSYPSMGLA